MAMSKLKKYIRKQGAPKLTDKQKAAVKDYHEYHGDEDIKIIGALPHDGVFVRVTDRFGHMDSVIDYLSSDGDCIEGGYLQDASEEEEIEFIKEWLKEEPFAADEEFIMNDPEIGEQYGDWQEEYLQEDYKDEENNDFEEWYEDEYWENLYEEWSV